jgi:nicotinamidase/pyrazinamidase
MIVHPETDVLIIIDVQNDFCPRGALAVEGGDSVIPVINAISPSFATVVATQDWHPENHVSFAKAHPGKEPYESVEIGGLVQELWPEHCLAGSPGAAFHKDLDLIPVGLVVRKGRSPGLDSYSAFFENDRRTPTGLDGFLRELGTKTVFLCGLATDYCVLFTALDAARLGFSTVVIRDGVRGVGVPEGSVERAFSSMAEAGVRIAGSSELSFLGGGLR